MGQMDPPHQIEAAINHFIDISRLTGGRIKLVFIFFHGQTVEVIAGTDGLAAVGSEDMRRRCREYLSNPCSGATPLDGALEEVNKVLEKSVSKNKTFVLISDGEPTTSLRPEIFGPVKKAIEKEESKREKSGGRQAVEAYRALLQDGQSQEYKAILDIQQPLLFERCLSLAAKTNQYNVRTVSLAFTPNLTKLQRIHEAVGGAAEDFVFIDKNSLFSRIHERQVFDSVLALPLIQIAASDNLESDTTFGLASDLQASCLIAIELDPIPDMDQHATFEVTVDGQTYRHTKDGADDRIIVSRDAKGRLSILSTVAGPAQSGSFQFKSHKDDLTFPGLKVYRYVEAPKNLQFVLHPESLSANEPSGFEVNQFSNEEWLCGLSWLNGSTIALKSAHVEFRHRDSNRDFLVDTNRAQHFNNRFKIQPPELPLGLFDAFVRFELESGITFETRIESHFKIVGVDEIIKIELFDDSNALESVDFGELGDVDLKRRIKAKLYSATPHDLDIQIKTLGLQDSQGNAVGQDWIAVSDPTINIPAGEAIEVYFECVVPDEIPEDVVDGLFESQLEITNAKTLQEISVEPLIEGTSDADSLCRLLFTLRRPELIVEAHYAGRQWIITDGDEYSIELDANVSTPFSRPVTFTVKTTSEKTRQVSVRVSNLRGEDGSAQSKIDVQPDENWVGPKPVEPNDASYYQAQFVVGELGADDARRVNGKVIFSGNGMRPIVINMVAGEGKSWARTIWFLFAGILAIGTCVTVHAYRTRQGLVQLTPGTQRRFRSSDDVFGIVQFQLIDNQAVVSPVKPIEVQDEYGVFEPQVSPLFFDKEQTPILIRSNDGMEIEIENFDPEGKQVWARVTKADVNRRKLRQSDLIRRFSMTTTVVCLALMILMQRWQPAARIVQYLLDVTHLT
jgi:hypothetical protein